MGESPIVIGIVGAEAAKFTPLGERGARECIRDLLREYVLKIFSGRPLKVISGRCHLGGVDIWAIEIAQELGLPTQEYPATRWNWSGPGGFMERNLKIANESDVVLCVVVDKYPPNFLGMRFKQCYHCRDEIEHVKSGGCWTMKQARAKGKNGFLAVIKNYPEVLTTAQAP